ncbi:ABC transporter permease [Microbulbifer sp. SSSA008]|uniref:ABC transporter permease n=1 Tax=Microbulbifer sp. SSSA008 TaxID=3243380 RepID=UPI004039BC02
MTTVTTDIGRGQFSGGVRPINNELINQMLKNYLSIVWVRGVGALKADSENSYLGSIWWVLEPVLLTALFYVAFSSGLRGGHSGSNFVFFLVCALIPFKWTSSSITISGTSISNNKGILNQFYLPKWIFPSSVNLSMLLRFLIVLPILAMFCALNGFKPNIYWLQLIPLIVCQLFVNLGFSYVAAAIVPLIPDVRNIISLGMTAILFSSGIFFDVNSRPEHIQDILRLNPFVTIFDSYRAILLRGELLDAELLIYPYLFSFCAFILGILILKKFDRFYPRTLL